MKVSLVANLYLYYRYDHRPYKIKHLFFLHIPTILLSCFSYRATIYIYRGKKTTRACQGIFSYACAVFMFMRRHHIHWHQAWLHRLLPRCRLYDIDYVLTRKAMLPRNTSKLILHIAWASRVLALHLGCWYARMFDSVTRIEEKQFIVKFSLLWKGARQCSQTVIAKIWLDKDES